ncbi:hypothetical protein [Roseibacillus ishigakijimensis]|uniref:Uncharacterized protein n=1 Tax=Roseibacillus ishigakijimensis TaxID=454146 RepID=A0A934RU60_9BACT|nr:hypothetical protein [Roseibacillus ishigakijimensis]MBK1835736.1 hypothetical protein [Roseibacillus ishigakijimensis]
MQRLMIVLISVTIGCSAVYASELWHDGKITPNQPFKAKVIGVKPGWGWDTIVLKELGGKGRYCLASVGHINPTYEIVAAQDFNKKEMIRNNTTFIDPAVDVERFSWTMGVWMHGKRFGEKDAATQFYKNGEQVAAPNP